VKFDYIPSGGIMCRSFSSSNGLGDNFLLKIIVSAAFVIAAGLMIQKNAHAQSGCSAPSSPAAESAGKL